MKKSLKSLVKRQVEMVKVSRGDIAQRVTADGRLAFVDKRGLTFGTSGKVSQVNVNELDKVTRGQVLAKPGSSTPHSEFDAEVYILTKEEGGRHTPFFTGYKPQFYFRTTDVTGEATLPAGTEMVMPGDTVKMTIKLIQSIAMEEQQRFAIREGGKTVGAGVVTKIIK